MNTALGFELTLDSNDYITRLLLKDKLFEAPESEVVTHILRPNDTCVDGGCHVGYYTCFFARLVGEGGRVYAFDANREICEVARSNVALNGLHNVEVIHAALADRSGETGFYISTDEETGLSSLGAIAGQKDFVTVPCIRLEDFLIERRIEHIRLLKIDVEGAEEITLRGLGQFLTKHQVDFILAECYDERLSLLGTSTRQVWDLLRAAGYIAWEYRGSAGWSTTTDVRSRGDCNYLFVGPSVTQTLPRTSFAAALIETRGELAESRGETSAAQGQLAESRGETSAAQGQLAQSRAETSAAQGQLAQSRAETSAAREEVASVSDRLLEAGTHIDALSRLLRESEEQVGSLQEKNRDMEDALRTMQDTTGWRALVRLRQLRDVIAPRGTSRRDICDAIVGKLRSRLVRGSGPQSAHQANRPK